MRIFQTFFQATIMLLLFSSISIAADFDWVGEFNRQAQADPSEFRTRLATRFQTGELQINAVLSDVSKPSDAYIVSQLGEISKQPMDRVMAEYKFSKTTGWDVVANRLRINSGSKEFKALKTSQDLYDGNENGKRKKKEKSKTDGNRLL